MPDFSPLVKKCEDLLIIFPLFSHLISAVLAHADSVPIPAAMKDKNIPPFSIVKRHWEEGAGFP